MRCKYVVRKPYPSAACIDRLISQLSVGALRSHRCRHSALRGHQSYFSIEWARRGIQSETVPALFHRLRATSHHGNGTLHGQKYYPQRCVSGSAGRSAERSPHPCSPRWHVAQRSFLHLRYPRTARHRACSHLTSAEICHSRSRSLRRSRACRSPRGRPFRRAHTQSCRPCRWLRNKAVL